MNRLLFSEIMYTQLNPNSPHNCSSLTLLFVTVMCQLWPYSSKTRSSFKSQSHLVLPLMCLTVPLTATSAFLTAPQPVLPSVARISECGHGQWGRRCETPESLTLEVCQCDYRDICQMRSTSSPHTIRGVSDGGLPPSACYSSPFAAAAWVCHGMVACARIKHLCSCFRRGRAHWWGGGGGAQTFSGRTRNA